MKILFMFLLLIFLFKFQPVKESGGRIVEVSVSQPRYRRSEPYTRHDHDISYDSSAGWFEGADWLICQLLPNQGVK